MGLSASSDEWCRMSDWIVEGLPWTIVEVNLVWASDLSTLEKRVEEVLERCKKINITISMKKFDIAEELIFAGYIFGAEGIKPDPQKVECIKNFPQLASATDIRWFLGMANQLAFFLPDYSHMSVQMRNRQVKECNGSLSQSTKRSSLS